MNSELKLQLAAKYNSVDWLDDVEIIIWWLSIRKWALAQGFTEQQLLDCKRFVWNGMKRPAPKVEVEKPKFIPASTARGEGGFYQSLGE